MEEVVRALSPAGSTRRGLLLSLIVSALVIGLLAARAIDLCGTAIGHSPAAAAEVPARANADTNAFVGAPGAAANGTDAADCGGICSLPSPRPDHCIATVGWAVAAPDGAILLTAPALLTGVPTTAAPTVHAYPVLATLCPPRSPSLAALSISRT